MAVPSSQRQKRYLNDLRKRLPTFPCTLAECGLQYSEFLKFDKRAVELQISDTVGGERQKWIRVTLEELEKWAAIAIKANEDKDIRAVRDIIAAGEDIFSKSFLRTVPLYKLITRTNRKRLRLLEEYESRVDSWIPLSVSITPIAQLEGILEFKDTERLNELYVKWGDLVSSGYFDLQMTLELLHGLHDEDLTENPSYPLLQKALKLLAVDLSKIDSNPLLVRVRQSVVSKLIAVVALSPVFGKNSDIPPTYAREVTRAIERANDSQFRKLCDQRLNMLLIRTFPQRVSELIGNFNKPYGSGSLARHRKSIRGKSLSSIVTSSQGMKTRSTRSDQPKHVRLTRVPIAALSKTLKEGERLLKLSKNDKDVGAAVDSLRDLLEECNEKQTLIDAAIEAGDISGWLTIDPTNSEVLWIYKLELEYVIGKILKALSGVRPGLYVKSIDLAKHILYRLRLEHTLSLKLLHKNTLAYQHVEEILASVPVEEAKYGLVKHLGEIHTGIRNKLRLRLAGMTVADLRSWLDSVTELQSGLFSLSTDACDQVVAARTLVSNVDNLFAHTASLLLSLNLTGVMEGRFGSLANAETLISKETSLRSSLSDILSKINDVKDVVKLCPQRAGTKDPVTWVEWLFALDWLVSARASLGSTLDVNSLISLHKRAEAIHLKQVSVLLREESVLDILEDISSKVQTITDLISEVESGDFTKLSKLDEYGLVTPEIERVKMDIQDYHARLDWTTSIAHQDSLVPMGRLVSNLAEIDEFNQRYNKTSPDALTELRSLVEVNSSLIELREREQVEQALEKLSRFTSEEIDRARKHLERTKELESEIDHLAKKSDSVNTSWNKLVELAETKYGLLKKAGKLKIMLSSRGTRRLVLSAFGTLSNLVQQWASSSGHTSRRPKWTYLFILRSVGGFVQSETGNGIPSLPWLTRQLDACNEIIKEAKKSLSDFAKARFMVPLFHFALFEPLEKIRLNLETKLGLTVALNYASTERRLESVSSHDNHGKVRERIFPRVGGPNKAALVEPADSNVISDLFEKRKAPESMQQAIEQLLILTKSMVADCKDSSANGQLGKQKSASSSEGGMSFTKFLSSSFSNLDISVAPRHEVDRMDELLQDQSGKSFLERYYELMSSSKRPSPPSTPSSSLPASGAATPLEKRKPIAPVSVGLPPGFAAPPKAVAPPTQAGVPEVSRKDQLILWQGDLVGHKHAFRLNVGLVPLFKSPSSQVLNHALTSHSNWQYEGSLGLPKFVEHYAKLMHPAHRAKREPFNLAIASEQSDRFMECLPANTATAFAIIVAPYKIKLWTVTADGTVPFHPLPLVPRIASAFIEMPLPLVQNGGPLENIFDPIELGNKIRGIGSELRDLGLWPIVECPEPVIVHKPAVEERMVEEPVPESQDPLLSRVYQAISARSELVPPAIPREVKRTRTEEPPPLPSQPAWQREPQPQPTWQREPPQQPPSWQAPPPLPQNVWNPMSAYYSRSVPVGGPMGPPPTMPSMVIGAPSSGPNIDHLPNPKKGACRFFNTVQGCQSGSRCKYIHSCSVCGSEEHPAMFHDVGQDRQGMYGQMGHERNYRY